jgi:hypothetical protein
MRIMTVVILGMLSACVVFPATAQQKLSREECRDQALKNGLADRQKGFAKFMRDCQAGKTPGVRRAAAGRAIRGSYEQCQARALAQGLGIGQAGNKEFVGECMSGRAGAGSGERR